MLRKPILRGLRHIPQEGLRQSLVGILKNSRSSLLILASITALLLIAQPLIAQDVRVGDAWQQVYQLLPDFPRENQYINQETGKVAENNTLVSRLIRYHIYVKARPVNYRLDWKLTLADYMGVNERMPSSTYPSADTLRTSPFQNDVAAIRSLNRNQREALVQTLVNVFTARSSAPEPDAAPMPQPSNTEPAVPTAPVDTPQREPRPGDAQLLLP